MNKKSKVDNLCEIEGVTNIPNSFHIPNSFPSPFGSHRRRRHRSSVHSVQSHWLRVHPLESVSKRKKSQNKKKKSKRKERNARITKQEDTHDVLGKKAEIEGDKDSVEDLFDPNVENGKSSYQVEVNNAGRIAGEGDKDIVEKQFHPNAKKGKSDCILKSLNGQEMAGGEYGYDLWAGNGWWHELAMGLKDGR
ncbi:hypothetical protein LIER_09775 [Lithospermum erythrorhizon]|uniref:Uncharacterized protein n=1 Tax=Lithospermum erythrorhizon TaxID=34254 RepID=A0AAV3PGV7_LITER